MNKTRQTSPLVTLAVVSAVQFTTPFLTSSINVAIPEIGRDLYASAVQLSLILTAMILAVAMFLLPVGRFSDIFGRKKIFLIGATILALSSFAIGLAGSIEVLLVLRYVQGAGCAMIMSTSFAILTAVFPPERRGRALGVIVSMVYLGSSLGPSISGFIINYAGWRWIFFIVFGMTALTIVLTLIWLKGEWITALGEPFDKTGTLIFMVSLGVFVVGASRLVVDPTAKWLLIGGLIGLVIFVIIEWKASYPLLDLRLLLNNLGFSFSNLATFFNYAAVMSFVFLLSLYLQYVKGLTPKQTGLLLIVQPVFQMILAPIAGRLADVYPPSIIATIGMGLCTTGMITAATIKSDSPFVIIIIAMLLIGIGLGMFSAPNMTAIMNSVGPKHHGTASSMVATMRTMGMLFSATATAVIFSIYLGDSPVTKENTPIFMESMHASLYLFSIMGFLGTLFSISKGRLASGASARKQARQGG